MQPKYACWNCGHQYQNFKYFCEKCHKILKPTSGNAFEHFGLKPEFIIDLDKLEIDYYNIQDKVHPDKFVGMSSEESLYAQIHSSNLNNSYQALTNIVSRCEVLLKYHGVETDNQNTISDPEVLNEVMEIQEKLENLNSKEKDLYAKEIKEKLKIYAIELNLAFEDHNFQNVKLLKTKISYLEKVVKDLRNN